MIILPAGATLPNHPRIGYANVVPDGGISSGSAAAGFPVSNLLNPTTYLAWRGSSTAAQTVTFSFGTATAVNYLGIAAHNLGTSGITYTLQSSDNNMTWTTIASDAPDDDKPIIHEIADTSANYYRLQLSSGSVAAQIAVVYLGDVLRMERRIYVGHQPVPFGYRRDVSTGRAEQGQFLGRTQRRTTLEFSVAMPNLTPAWCRSDLLPFIDVSDITPFFWAWRPEDYPDEVGYCWTLGDPQAKNQRPNGMMEFSMQVQGIG